ncbi:MAG: sugar transferase [Saprospiraceae bacterium]|nr:sugar transferase [Saprospiraceae bacterium]MBK8372255.1 sugar transferase [Saprospiraceae bacterium]
MFYLQERKAHKNKPYFILKFATLLKHCLNIGSGIVTERNDPKITPLGKFLRLSKLNELPQVISVIKVEMPLVGARP